MLDGFVPWPPEMAARYRAEGLWEGRTIAAMVAAQATARPDQVAVIDGERRTTYAEIVTLVDRVACRLRDAGLRPRDRVVMQLPNSLAFVVAYLALTRIGAIPVMALRAHRETEIAHFVRSSAAVAYMIPDVVQGFDFRALAQTVAAQCPTLATTFVLGEPLAGQQALAPMIEEPRDTAMVAAHLADAPQDASEVATMLLHDRRMLRMRLAHSVRGAR